MKVIELFLVFFCFFNLNGFSQASHNQQWPGFRGPWGKGYLEDVKPATTWNAETGEHIKWKTAIPGLAHSSPDYLGQLPVCNHCCLLKLATRS